MFHVKHSRCASPSRSAISHGITRIPAPARVPERHRASVMAHYAPWSHRPHRGPCHDRSTRRPVTSTDSSTDGVAEPTSGSGAEEGASQATATVTVDEPAHTPAHTPARTLPRIIALANQKGGVGKTTTTVNLGAALAEMGLRTLIIDLDPQGNASTGLGIENRGLEHSMYHVLMHEEPLENVVEPTDVRNLFVAPASLDLAGAEIELVPAFSREQRLKRAIDAVLDDYDYVLDRLSPVARPSDGERTRCGPRGDGADPVRVLRAGGTRPTPAQRRSGQAQSQSDTRREHHPVRDVRRPHQSVRPGGQRGPRTLRRQGACAR